MEFWLHVSDVAKSPAQLPWHPVNIVAMVTRDSSVVFILWVCSAKEKQGNEMQPFRFKKVVF